MSIDITGLDRAAVLAALYNSARQIGMGFLHARGGEPMTVEQAAVELATRGDDPYFDYLHGRVMKIDLAGDQLEERLYDRDNGQGSCAAAVESVRAAAAA